MQPQHHNLESQTGTVAAGLDQSAASMAFAADNVLAAASEGAAIAARAAAAENKVAASPAAATQSILTILKQYWRRLQKRRQRQRLSIALHELSERELTDIGVTRAEIETITAHRTLDRLKSGMTRL